MCTSCGGSNPLSGNKIFGDNGKVLFSPKDDWWYSLDYRNAPVNVSYYGNTQIKPLKKSSDKILTAIGILLLGAFLLDSVSRA